jgi:hypothetical protein
MTRHLTTAISIILLIGCCGGSKKGKEFLCEASIEGVKANHFSIDTDADQAEAKTSAIWGACYTFCNWEDSEVDAAYQDFKGTEEGMKSRVGRVANIDMQVELEIMRDKCVKKCQASVASGLVPIKVQCSGPQSGTCETKLTYEKKTTTATKEGDQSKYHSRRMACRNHCIENDESLDALYQAWKLTDDGKTSPWKDKAKALDQDSFLSDYTNNCQGNCLGNIMRGKAEAQTTCK